MKEEQENDLTKYFDDNCLIEDDVYNSMKDLIKCNYCNKILKEPMVCTKCQKAFCRSCTVKLEEENHQCVNPTYTNNEIINLMLGRIKYRCKNCQMETKKEDIKSHINKGCIRNENPTKLMEAFNRKAQLRKVEDSEIKEFPKRKIKVNHISGKIFLLIINLNNIFLL